MYPSLTVKFPSAYNFVCSSLSGSLKYKTKRALKYFRNDPIQNGGLKMYVFQHRIMFAKTIVFELSKSICNFFQ